jgi:DNA-binding SARP family transcriptional activator/tetratricopeptide (TPR) repeat protein
VWFAILGPLLVHDGNTQIDVPKGRQRALLAALLLHTGTPISADTLAEVVWDGTPPAGADVTLRSYVLRLRRTLGRRAAARVLTRYPGYLIEASDEEVDLLRFRSLTQEAGAALRAGHCVRTWDLLTEGLGLWRGKPLVDVPSEVMHRDLLPELERERLEATEWRVDAGLRLGRHSELVPELWSLVDREPLRERLHCQLMLALARCGRQAEALEAYQSARETLAEQLGTDPGIELRELHQRILTADPSLAPPEPAAQTGAVPRQLPAPVAGFAGRAGELAALTGLLRQSTEGLPPAVVISAIGGTAGVGKTALAVQWAHQVADRFPDGQLYVNLRGYDPDQPMPPADALAGFLRALGVPGQDIPAEDDERAARYRSLLAGKKMLAVLDNAGSVEQVRPLLPGSPSCAVLVTSRDSLAGLVARHGATRLELDLLPPAEAVGLLRTLIGSRVDDDPGAAGMLAGQCCRLPLALRVAAELAVARPGVPLAKLVGELADQRGRLDLFDAGGDPRTAVRAVFSWSYRHLEPDTARVFRLVGLHPGADFDPYAVAALAGTGLDHTRAILGVLARAHLIQSRGPGRYAMHDLLHAYARELTTADVQQVALTRLFDYYLHTAAAAMDTLYPAERHRRPAVPRTAAPIPRLADPAAAREWLDAERATVVAITGHATAYGWPGHATLLAGTVSRYLRNGGHILETLAVFDHALDAARRTGDRIAEATTLKDIGNVDLLRCRFELAADHYRQALALFRAADDRAGEAGALGNMGVVDTELGHYEEAARHQHEALVIFRAVGDHLGEARALGNLGHARRLQGRYQEAAVYHRHALDLSRQIDDRPGEADALARLGDVGLRLGRFEHAAGYLQQALALCRDMGNRADEAETLVRLGDVYLELARYEQATGNYEQALAAVREIGDRFLEAEALNGLGDVSFHTGQIARARERHAAALQIASTIGTPREQAHAHTGLARACDAEGDLVQARRHWQQALVGYTAIGAPEADEARARLAVIGGTDSDDPSM